MCVCAYFCHRNWFEFAKRSDPIDSIEFYNQFTMQHKSERKIIYACISTICKCFFMHAVQTWYSIDSSEEWQKVNLILMPKREVRVSKKKSKNDWHGTYQSLSIKESTNLIVMNRIELDIWFCFGLKWSFSCIIVFYTRSNEQLYSLCRIMIKAPHFTNSSISSTDSEYVQYDVYKTLKVRHLV